MNPSMRAPAKAKSKTAVTYTPATCTVDANASAKAAAECSGSGGGTAGTGGTSGSAAGACKSQGEASSAGTACGSRGWTGARSKITGLATGAALDVTYDSSGTWSEPDAKGGCLQRSPVRGGPNTVRYLLDDSRAGKQSPTPPPQP